MAGHIRFPSMHVAQSTANRIMNVADGIQGSAPEPVQPPLLPDVERQGQALDAQLETPPVPVELPPGSDGAVVQAALAGDDLSQAAVAPNPGVPGL